MTGDFALGDFVPVSLQFGNGEQVEMDVPVVPNCDDFADLDGTVRRRGLRPRRVRRALSRP